MKATDVPVTPTVLHWAIRESGYTIPEVAKAVGVDDAEVGSWLLGKSSPKLTPFRKLATILHRPAAAFFLAEPPSADPMAVKFRRPPNVERKSLNPSERRHLREARRVQETMSWLLQELGEQPIQLPKANISDPPEEVAAEARRHLAISVETQHGWADESKAQAAWRDALERSGVSVIMLRLGEHSCRGFSLWDAYAPFVAVNTYFRPTARVFTMLHEYGHLLTRSSSACIEQGRGQRLAESADPTERWCERFAAAVLLPRVAVRKQLNGRGTALTLGLADAAEVSRRFKVSLRAAVIRLIEMGLADWQLYRQIPPRADDKPRTGGGRGMKRAELREQEFGRKLQSLFVHGMREDLISRSDVLSHLRLSEDDLEGLEAKVRR